MEESWRAPAPSLKPARKGGIGGAGVAVARSRLGLAQQASPAAAAHLGGDAHDAAPRPASPFIRDASLKCLFPREGREIFNALLGAGHVGRRGGAGGLARGL